MEEAIIYEMNKSKTNEIGVLLLHTPNTNHHLYTYNQQSDDSDDSDVNDVSDVSDVNDDCDSMKVEVDHMMSINNDQKKTDVDMDMDMDMDMDIDIDDTHDNNNDKCNDNYNDNNNDIIYKNKNKYKNKDKNKSKNKYKDKNKKNSKMLFQHITQFVPLHKPTVDTLRQIRSISISSKISTSSTPGDSDGGGFIDGIILATDILHSKTGSKRYSRKIILFTDGQQPIHDMRYQYMGVVFQAMREMECEIIVYGYDFDSWSNVCFHVPHDVGGDNGGDNDGHNGDDDGDNDSNNDGNHEHKLEKVIKVENQKLLMSIVKYTSGQIHSISSSTASSGTSGSNATNNSTHTIKTSSTKSTTSNYKKSSSHKTILNIAPNNLLSIPIRVSSYTIKSSIPSLKREAIIYNTTAIHTNNNIATSGATRTSAPIASQDDSDSDCNTNTNSNNDHSNQKTQQDQTSSEPITTSTTSLQKTIMKDILGNEMTTPIINSTTHWDTDNPEVEVEMKYRTNGYMYGSDVIPIDQFDLEGLKYRSSSSSSSTIATAMTLSKIDTTALPSTSAFATSGASYHTTGSGLSSLKSRMAATSSLPSSSSSSSSSSLPCINILGYSSLDPIPMRYWIGPIKMISGDSNKNTSYKNSCNIISSLAQALHELDKVAICTYISSRNGDPVMSMLVPFIEKQQKGVTTKERKEVEIDGISQQLQQQEQQPLSSKPVQPQYLLLLRLPFADDVQDMNMHPIDDAIGDEDAIKVCDDLIDHFMLPPETLCNETIPHPAIKSYHKTVINRAIDPISEKGKIVIARERKGVNEMATPPDILKAGKDILKKFRQMFPLEVIENNKSKGRKKKKYWNELD
jgi:hypothetical protein